MKIYPYKSGSASAKALAEALGVKRLRREGGLVKDTVINWGCAKLHRDMEGSIINIPANVAKAANKLETFKALDGCVGIPEWTESFLEASRWLTEGFIVVSRMKLNGHSGEGLLISDPAKDEGLPEAPLYTKYIKKREEYRVHVFREEAFFIQRKARNMGLPNEAINWQIRNHDNGFIFAHKNVDVPPEVKYDCIGAVRILGLDFGACDVVHGIDDEYYILEINSAPGLEGSSLEAYAEQFRKLM